MMMAARFFLFFSFIFVNIRLEVSTGENKNLTMKRNNYVNYFYQLYSKKKKADKEIKNSNRAE